MTDKAIMIVEDDGITRFLMSELCETLGLRSDIVDSGEACLQRLAADPGAYELVLMDMHMPKRSGADVTQEIRQFEGNPPRDIPVIATTADQAWADSALRARHRLDGYLPKPVRREAMLEVLSQYRAA
ncbi:response regulator [Rhodobacteraceae bacterium CCMM004]|nr:response regulator [Rhodobacteraceae bacterium CCMM004]